MSNQSDAIKKQILSLVGKDLVEIETALDANLDPWQDLVRDTAGHIIFAGGKRLRPLLMVICARICDSETPAVIRFSTIFEYLHAATLLHDDLVDGARLRRGKPAAHHVFGNETAVLTGDFLLARSLSIAAETQNLEVIRIIGDITEQMSQGEIEQLQNRGRIDLSEAAYLETIRRKTAVLIEGACHVGALLGGASASESEALKGYGHRIGMAFQMADDLLDYTSDPEGLGKVVGADLREGKLTLPVIAALKAASRKDRDWMEKMIQSDTFSDSDFQTFRTLLEKYGGIAYTRVCAEKYVADARSCLQVFPASSQKTLLELIATYALLRKA